MAKKKTSRRTRSNTNGNGAPAPNLEPDNDVNIAMLVDIEAGMAYRRDAEDRLVNHYLILCGAVFTIATVVSSNIKLNFNLKWASCLTISGLLVGAWLITMTKILWNHRIYEKLGKNKFCFLERLPIHSDNYLQLARGYGSGKGYWYSIALISLVGAVALGWSIAVILLPHVK